jgi:sugar phosphate isomerase/epimerase
MRLGYNTNGFAHHDLLTAIEVLAEIGYRSIAITLDYHCLNPLAGDLRPQLDAVIKQLGRWNLGSVVETGARFLLDPRRKHEPTLVSRDPEERVRRVTFLCRAIDVAHDLGSDCVSLWSGVVRDGAPDDVVWMRLCDSLQPVLDHAAARGVLLGFEPEPGMFIDTMSRWESLLERRGAPHLLLTLDIGHLHCLREWPIVDQITRWGSQIVNVHLEDMRAGVHEHLMFGEGEMDFASILNALRTTDYQGGVHVELSRHSHEAPHAARKAWEFLIAHMNGDAGS